MRLIRSFMVLLSVLLSSCSDDGVYPPIDDPAWPNDVGCDAGSGEQDASAASADDHKNLDGGTD
jgi:hypothetical protein